ncbi:MAG: hypothetical protein K2X03_14790 [Bryobacteraceae bacterium]|nr:hypothetical protein [Bryobacteraceae bacterium]
MKHFFSLLLLSNLATAGQLFYSKSFPNSVPAYVSIQLSPTGEIVYKEAVDDEQPVKLKIEPNEAAEIFALAEKLEHFKRTLESGLKVAFMGEKTFRWEPGAGAPVTEQKFNYSQDPDAIKLQDWFERITESEMLFFTLERTVKYDKLGVYKALLQLEAAYDRKRLVAWPQYLPLLDRVAKNSSYMNVARERAASLAEVFRNPPPPPPPADPPTKGKP